MTAWEWGVCQLNLETFPKNKPKKVVIRLLLELRT